MTALDWLIKNWSNIAIYTAFFIILASAVHLHLFFNTCEDCIDKGLCTEPLRISYIDQDIPDNLTLNDNDNNISFDVGYNDYTEGSDALSKR